MYKYMYTMILTYPSTSYISNVVVSKMSGSKKGSKLAELFKDYCSNATLHGIGYLGAKDRSLTEKIWWIIVFLVSFSACAFLISRTWTKWENSPVIVSFAKEQTPLWEIPFPAVTICPLYKVQQNIYNYTKYFNERESLTGAERKYFWDVSLVCNLDYFGFDERDGDLTTDEEAIQNIIKVAPKDFITVVKWQFMTYGSRSTYFTPILTEEGICFTSNSLNQKDMITDELNHNISFLTHNRKNCGWDIENGYPPGLGLDVYPRRTGQDGYGSGLRISLKTNIKQIDYICGIPVYGYKPRFLTLKCYEEKVLYQTKKRIYKKCNCLPACTSLHFAADTSTAEGHFLKTTLSIEGTGIENHTDIDDIRNGNVLMTKVDVFFKGNHIIAVERSELYGQTEFLANCGGLLGLFLGFSVLSFIEIVYYLTIRVYTTLRQTKKDG